MYVCDRVVRERAVGESACVCVCVSMCVCVRVCVCVEDGVE